MSYPSDIPNGPLLPSVPPGQPILPGLAAGSPVSPSGSSNEKSNRPITVYVYGTPTSSQATSLSSTFPSPQFEIKSVPDTSSQTDPEAKLKAFREKALDLATKENFSPDQIFILLYSPNIEAVSGTTESGTSSVVEGSKERLQSLLDEINKNQSPQLQSVYFAAAKENCTRRPEARFISSNSAWMVYDAQEGVLPVIEVLKWQPGLANAKMRSKILTTKLFRVKPNSSDAVLLAECGVTPAQPAKESVYPSSNNTNDVIALLKNLFNPGDRVTDFNLNQVIPRQVVLPTQPSSSSGWFVRLLIGLLIVLVLYFLYRAGKITQDLFITIIVVVIVLILLI